MFLLLVFAYLVSGTCPVPPPSIIITDAACLSTPSVQRDYVPLAAGCDSQIAACSSATSCANITSCYTAALQCHRDALATLPEGNVCDTAYAMATDDDVIYHQCIAFASSCCPDVVPCRAIADTTELWCRRPANNMCKARVDDFIANGLALVNADDIFESLAQCMASTGRYANVTKCIEATCGCEGGTMVGSQCLNPRSFCGTLNCTRSRMVCTLEKAAPFVTQGTTVECREAGNAIRAYTQSQCERDVCSNEDNMFCSSDEISGLCRTMVGIYHSPARVAVPFVLGGGRSAFGIPHGEWVAMKRGLAAMLNVDDVGLVVAYMDSDDALTLSTLGNNVTNIIPQGFQVTQAFKDTFLTTQPAPSWCSLYAEPPSGGGEECTSACRNNFTQCMGRNVTTQSIPMEDCWQKQPACRLAHMSCLAKCGNNNNNNINVAFAQCMGETCRSAVAAYDCSQEEHTETCRYAVGMTTTTAGVRPSALPMPTRAFVPATTAPPQDAAFLTIQNNIMACLSDGPSSSVAFTDSMGLCTAEYMACLDNAMTKPYRCPQKNVVNMTSAQECFEQRYQCFFEWSNAILWTVPGTLTLLPQYMASNLQYGDCVWSYENDDVFSGTQTVAQRMASCEEVKDLAAMWGGAKPQIHMITGRRVEEWTPVVRTTLRDALSRMTNVDAEDVCLFVMARPGNTSAVKMVLKDNPQRRNASSSVFVTDAAVIDALLDADAPLKAAYNVSLVRVFEVVLPDNGGEQLGPGVDVAVGVLGVAVIVAVAVLVQSKGPTVMNAEDITPTEDDDISYLRSDN